LIPAGSTRVVTAEFGESSQIRPSRASGPYRGAQKMGQL
jgi:hypothetical protein